MDIQTETLETLPSGSKTEETAKVEAFEKIVQQSKENIQAEALNQVKRKPGRPRKSPPKDSSLNHSTGFDAGTDASMHLPAQLDLKPVLKGVLKVPFSIVANKTRVKEIELTDDEAEAPIFYANELVNLYMPDLQRQDPKKVVAWSLALSLGMIVAQKYAIYSEKINEIKSKQEISSEASPVSPAPNLAPQSQTLNGLDAGDYFSGRIQ